MFSGIYLSNSIDMLLNADKQVLFVMFWYFLILELPRYLIAGFATLVAYVFFDKKQEAPKEVKISLLLPGYNEGKSLRKTIFSVKEQTRKPDQIVVVDDGSTDDMLYQANKLKKEGLIDIVLSNKIRCGKSSAANLGLGFCSGDVIIITDIDTSFDRDAFENAIKPLSDEKVGAVAGNLGVRNPFESVVCAYQTIQYLISISLGRRVTHMLGILSIVSGAFGVFRKDLLLACGGWEVGPGEDADLTLKIRNAGYKIAFAPNAWALTDVPNSLFALIRQRLRWNRSLVRIRLRKFKTLLNPYNKNFSILNAISTIDAFSFQFFLAVSFYAYIIWLFIYYGEFGLIILFLISSVYVLTGLLSFSIASIASKRRASLALIPYALTYGLFNSFVLRAVRVYAYLDELLYRKSYKDSYVPQKVLDNTEKF